MKTKTIKVFSFNELSEHAKENAKQYYYEHWLPDSLDWSFRDLREEWQSIGVKIVRLDPDYRICDISMDDPEFTAENILKTFRESCDHYKTAAQFIAELYAERTKYGSPDPCQDPEFEPDEHDKAEKFFDAVHEMTREFQSELSYEILRQWTEDMDYLTSDSYIQEMFEANDVEFFENGRHATV